MLLECERRRPSRCARDAHPRTCACVCKDATHAQGLPRARTPLSRAEAQPCAQIGAEPSWLARRTYARAMPLRAASLLAGATPAPYVGPHSRHRRGPHPCRSGAHARLAGAAPPEGRARLPPGGHTALRLSRRGRGSPRRAGLCRVPGGRARTPP
jgi:hypothetical protein